LVVQTLEQRKERMTETIKISDLTAEFAGNLQNSGLKR
jgi:hypothetical protein